MDKETGWGFLGIGRVTPRMVAAVRATAGHDVVAVAARNPEKLEQWAQTHRVDTALVSFEELINRSEVDCVYNGLPPSLHASLASFALRCRKPVLCEKPLAMNYTEAQMLARVAAETNTPLWHATAFPFHPRSLAMREIVRSGELGDLCRVTIACSASHILQRGPDYRTSSELGGGCLLDLGWYCVYATLWLTGLKVVDWQATGRRIDGDESSPWLSVQVLANLDNGATAIWDCGFDAAGRKWMEVAGTKGSVVCDDFLRPWNLEKPRFWVHEHDGLARAEIVGAGVSQESEMIAAVSKGSYQDAAESLELAIETHRILDGINAAASRGRSSF